jgi:predicted ATPase/DNA-binding winged helix-turn-helix (wHTH) protein
MELTAERTYSFDAYTLDLRRGCLRGPYGEIELRPKSFETLRHLVENAGRLVAKDELARAVWREVSVADESVTRCVSEVRLALGDKAQRLIKTVPRRGYIFTAAVSLHPAAAGSTKSVPEAAGAGSGASDPPRASAFLIARDARGARAHGPGDPQTLPAQLARMVGRADAVQKVTETLSTHRFVTIVGPGGIGKTTVATAAAHALSPAFAGQVAFVDLGPLADPRLVVGAVASTLGLMISSDDPIAGLIASLRDTRLLLILDSCEHVIQSVAVLAETLFNAAPSLHILATSQEALRTQGEHVHRLFPLVCPPHDADVNASDVLEFPAAQLFIERATATSGGLELTDADASAVAQICRRLDGIPLALELAAAGVSVFGIKGLAARLDDRLLLAARGRRTAMPRHQTLRATLDWSYDRLPKTEQLLLNRLAIFSGAFTFEAASAVCSGSELCEDDIPAGILDLIAKSLVTAGPTTDVSYRLLDTTRSYGSEKLEQSGERPALAERHARYICTLFESASKQWEEQPAAGWLATYRIQIDNLRAALKWAFSETGDPALGVALTIAAVPLWSQLSLVDEFRDWVEHALSASAQLPDMNRRGQMQLHAALGGLQMYAISSVRHANNAWESTLALATELSDIDYQLRALRALWAEAINSGKFRQALALAERFRSLAIETEHADDEIVSDRLIGTALHFLGEHEKAGASIERMLDRYLVSAARSHLVRHQFNQKVAARLVRGRILWLQGRPVSALDDIAQNVAEALALDHTMSLCNVLTQAACPIALLAGELDAARRYVDLLRERTAPRSLDIWYTYAVCFEAGLEMECGNIQLGLDRLQAAMEELRRSGFAHYRTSFLMMRARGLLVLDRSSAARAAVAEAISICERTGERWCLPELYRLDGEITLRHQGGARTEAAIETFQRALLLARDQQALAWELRAATSLARCLADDGRGSAARIALKEICAQFREGHDNAELMAAAALLEQPTGSGSNR